MHGGQVSSTDQQPKVSCSEMNHENLEKITSNKAQVKLLHTWAQAFSSLEAPEAFWLAECQPQQKCRSWQPEWGIAKLQIGIQKQALLQLNPESNGVHDAERVQLSPDQKAQTVYAWKQAQGVSSSKDRCPKEQRL
jgi:hypothetical protein